MKSIKISETTTIEVDSKEKNPVMIEINNEVVFLTTKEAIELSVLIFNELYLEKP